MTSQTALLLDISGIQSFIFASSKLKENLGASHLVSNLYSDTIPKISIQPLKDSNDEFRGYLGGGNALLLFNSLNDAERFLEEWTRLLLIYAPGITISSAIGEIEENGNFSITKNELFDQLRKNKTQFISQTLIPRHGISAECNSDGLAMDVWNNSEQEYVSASTNAKIEAYNDAKDKIKKEYKELLNDRYCFTGELDKLGQSMGSENHIGIVHIDGNSMGDRFKELSSLEATRSLSKSLENAIKESFEKLVEFIISELKDPIKKEFLNIKKDGGRDILPIRPIILGGDDITFVCEGRMGIYYAKIFMEEFAKQVVSDGNPLSSSAGIAVIKTNYPFYKGYQLAEELCANAKNRRRELGDDGSWIDFHITYGGFSGPLNEIRNTHYKVNKGSLIFRPYKIAEDTEYSLLMLIKNCKSLKKNWPNNKIKELRDVLTLSDDAINVFYNETKARQLVLPDILGKHFNQNIFVNKETPYFDMIELLEYYPKYELEVK